MNIWGVQINQKVIKKQEVHLNYYKTGKIGRMWFVCLWLWSNKEEYKMWVWYIKWRPIKEEYQSGMTVLSKGQLKKNTKVGWLCSVKAK